MAAPIFFFLLFFLTQSLARGPHVITIPTANLHPSSLAWDPTAQHFLIASHHLVSSVSDAGVVESLITLPPSSNVSAIALDDIHRRLILTHTHPASIISYDLRSPRPHRQIFSSSLPDESGGVTVDPATGDAFVTGDSVIWKVSVDGQVDVLSESKAFNGGIDGVAHVRMGYLLAVQGGSGRVFKVDAEDGAARALIVAAAEVTAVAGMSDGSVVVAGGNMVRMLKSQDGWSEAGVYDKFVVEEGVEMRGVAVRNGRKVYVLVVPVEDGGEKSNGSARIEEVEWEREQEGDMVWGMVLLGLGLTYFLYWRFQMGKLAGNMNKKRA